MGRFRIFFCGLVVSISACLGASQAATVSRTVNFSNTISGSGSGAIQNADGNGLIGTNFNPFDNSLGTLQSFQVLWTVSVTASGVSSASQNGSLTSSLSGTVYFSTSSYAGFGGGQNASGVPGSSISATGTGTNNKFFLVSDANVNYDPFILATVTGGSLFDLSFSSGGISTTIGTTFNDMASISSEMTGSVTLTYFYAASGVPEPTSFAIVSVLCTGLIAMQRRRLQR